MKLEEPPLNFSEVQPDTAYTNISDILYSYCVERDNQLCIICGNQGSDLHHVVYKSLGGKHRPNNLATLCKKHHNQVHEGVFGSNIVKILIRKLKSNDKIFRRRLK